MDPDLAVIDQALLGAVNEFYGVFDGDDVIFSVEIRVVYHGCEGGGLAGTRRACDQHQSFAQHRKALQDWGEAEFFKREDFAGDQAEDGSDAAALIEEIGTVAGDPRIFVAEVYITRFLEGLDFVFRLHSQQ